AMLIPSQYMLAEKNAREYNSHMFASFQAGLAFLLIAGGAVNAASVPELTLDIRDYVTMPMTGKVNGTGQIMGLLARENFMREEPGPNGKKRFFVNDLNGPLYILDKQSGKFTTYLNFNGRNGQTGLFARLPTESGFANGFISFTLDPDYVHNGKFYTIHLEDFSAAGSEMPDGRSFPGLKLDGYQTTPAIVPPGATTREAVLIEWTDTNTADEVFEGTAREILRVRLTGQIDPIPGKILRISPDLNYRKDSSTVSQNGRYRIPNDNPFVSAAMQKAGVRGEIWAYGLRNPARLTWDVDPANPRDNHLIADVIGLNTWETVDFIHKGANYGYSRREGNQALELSNKTTELPADDRIPVMLNATETNGTVTPAYPVIEYPHAAGGGDAMSSGYVYHGKAFPALRGKYIFGDLSTGNVWWADFKEMLARSEERR